MTLLTKNIAIIDLGTNTFHLLVAALHAEGYKIVYEEKLPTKIGMGGINQGIITHEATERAIAVLKGYRQTVDAMGVEQTLAFGTSAFRSAHNQLEVISKIKEATGFEIKVISGEEEADFIYKGVRAAVKLGHQNSLIVDIGGGSVEFIMANEYEIFWKQSYEIGGQRLLERFQKHDPILPEEVAALDAYLLGQLESLLVALKEFKPKTLVGSSGVFDTLSEIDCYRNGLAYQKQPETQLTLQAIQEIHAELLRKNRAERMQIPGMIELRVDMIVVASCLVNFLLKKHRFENVRVSSYSLKEGVLHEINNPLKPGREAGD
jgi:exopolyphosphatase/guanosine-5'-triphosphate,3'-diphosphate pyrophosphatase